MNVQKNTKSQRSKHTYLYTKTIKLLYTSDNTPLGGTEGWQVKGGAECYRAPVAAGSGSLHS